MGEFRNDVKLESRYQKDFEDSMRKFRKEAKFRKDIDKDLKEATDTIVELPGGREFCMAQRVRSGDSGYHARYHDEFSIRGKRPSGKLTELDKILSGYGDYMWYAWFRNGKIFDWYLIDLRYFRKEFRKGNLSYKEIPNTDSRGSTGYYFKLKDVLHWDSNLNRHSPIGVNNANL